MENETIWKVGLVVLVLLVVVGVYNNNNKFTEEVTGEVIGDSITGQVIGNTNEVGLFKRVGIGKDPLNTINKNRLTPLSVYGSKLLGSLDMWQISMSSTDQKNVMFMGWYGKRRQMEIETLRNNLDGTASFGKIPLVIKPEIIVFDDPKVKVGIGTSDPQTKLDVNGTLIVRGSNQGIFKECSTYFWNTAVPYREVVNSDVGIVAVCNKPEFYGGSGGKNKRAVGGGGYCSNGRMSSIPLIDFDHPNNLPYGWSIHCKDVDPDITEIEVYVICCPL